MSALPISDYHAFPDANGHFGRYGGRFVADTLMEPIAELAAAYDAAKADPAFQQAFDRDLAHYVGRPSPIYHAERLSEAVGGARILLKREDLNHTGAHKINNTVGQALLASRMGKTRIIAETGAGQHGVASATVAARLGLECVVYMGATDIERQKINVYRMKLLGATVIAAASSEEKLAIARERGADHLVLYAREPFRDAVKRLTDGRGADVVFDPVGGEVFENSMRCINWGARILVVGFTGGIGLARTNLLMIKGASVLGVRAGEAVRKDPALGEVRFKALSEWAEAGRVRPNISHRLPLEDYAKAMRLLIERKAIGRVALMMQ